MLGARRHDLHRAFLNGVAYNVGDDALRHHRGPSIITIDANRRFVRRAVRRVRQLAHHLRGHRLLAGRRRDWGTEYRTRYTYDVEGQLTQVQDHLGNLTGLMYDELGRKASMNDRDMGAVVLTAMTRWAT